MIYFVAAVLSLMAVACIPRKSARKCFRYHKFVFHIDFQIVLAALPFFLLSAVRYGIGTDYFYSYVPQFKNVLEGREIYFEKGFYLLIKLITIFTDNYQWLFVITSFLFIFLTFKEIFEQSENRILSVVLFFLSYSYFISLNNIRQSLAMAIVLYAMKYLKKEQYRTYIIWILIAGLMHQVAFAYLLFVLIRKVNIPSWCLMAAAAVVLVLKNPVYSIAVKVLWKIPRFQYYILNQVYIERSISTLVLLGNIVIMLILVVIELQYQDACEGNMDFAIMKWSQFGVLAVCCLDGFMPAAYRLLRIFSFMQFVFLPNAIRRTKDSRQRLIYLVMILAIFTLIFLQLYLSGSEQVFPYRSIFNKGI